PHARARGRPPRADQSAAPPASAAARRVTHGTHANAPGITRVLETALYVDDLERATAFYRDVLGLRIMSAGPRLVSIEAGQAPVLLLFHRGATVDGLRFPGGFIPPHDGHGPAHFAFAIAASAWDAWERHLAEHGVAVDS